MAPPSFAAVMLSGVGLYACLRNLWPSERQFWDSVLGGFAILFTVLALLRPLIEPYAEERQRLCPICREKRRREEELQARLAEIGKRSGS
jgi:hypothetical protein